MSPAAYNTLYYWQFLHCVRLLCQAHLFGQAIGNSIVNRAMSRPSTTAQPQGNEGQTPATTPIGNGQGATQPTSAQSNGAIIHTTTMQQSTTDDGIEEVVVTGTRPASAGSLSPNQLMAFSLSNNSATAQAAERALQEQQLANARLTTDQASNLNLRLAAVQQQLDFRHVNHVNTRMELNQRTALGIAMGDAPVFRSSGTDFADMSQWTIEQKLGFARNVINSGYDRDFEALANWTADQRLAYKDAGAELFARGNYLGAMGTAFLTGAVELGYRGLEGIANTGRLFVNDSLRSQAVASLQYAVMHPIQTAGSIANTLANNSYDENLILAMELMLGGGHKALQGIGNAAFRTLPNDLSFARTALSDLGNRHVQSPFIMKPVGSTAFSGLAGFYESVGVRSLFKPRAINIDELMSVSVDGLSVKRILPGTNGKVAVIGRTFGGDHVKDIGVVEFAQELSRRGYKTELFGGHTISNASRQEWKNMVKNFGDENGIIPQHKLIGTIGFKENKAWAKNLLDEGYTVIDIGNPNNKGFSVYYAAEKKIVFKESGSR